MMMHSAIICKCMKSHNTEQKEQNTFVDPLAGIQVSSRPIGTDNVEKDGEGVKRTFVNSTPVKKKRKDNDSHPGLVSPTAVFPVSPCMMHPMSPFSSHPYSPGILATPPVLAVTPTLPIEGFPGRPNPNMASPAPIYPSKEPVVTDEYSSKDVSSKSRVKPDTSLHDLTVKVVELIKGSENGIIDLSVASKELGFSKRRFYDIANVLEGVGIVKKISKNVIQWAANASETSARKEGEIATIQKEIEQLEKEEKELDRQIEAELDQLNKLTENEITKKYAYITYSDILQIPRLANETIIGIKAPTGTTLTVPDQSNSDGDTNRYQISMKSSNGPIDLYLIQDEGMSAPTSRPENTSHFSPVASQEYSSPHFPVSSLCFTPSRAVGSPLNYDSPRANDHLSMLHPEESIADLFLEPSLSQ